MQARRDYVIGVVSMCTIKEGHLKSKVLVLAEDSSNSAFSIAPSYSAVSAFDTLPKHTSVLFTLNRRNTLPYFQDEDFLFVRCFKRDRHTK